MTLSLASALGWLLLIHRAPFMNPSLPAWLTETGIWVILAMIGICLFSYVFPSSGFIRAIRLGSGAHLMTGLAWAACWPAAWKSAQNGNPTLFLLASVLGVLPDTLDHWIAQYLQRTHIHIVPDPLLPDTQMMSETLTLGIARCRDYRRSVRLQIYPGQTQTGQWHHYTIHFNNLKKRLVITHDRVATSTPLPCTITTDESFTLETEAKPLCLELRWVSDGRISLCVNPRQRQWSHSLVTAAGFGVLAAVMWGRPAGYIAFGAYALHSVVDQLGFTGTGLLFPLIRKNMTGLQLLLPSRKPLFHTCVIWMALLLTCWNGVRIIFPETALPSLISVILLGGVLPCTILGWIVRINRQLPAPFGKPGLSRRS